MSGLAEAGIAQKCRFYSNNGFTGFERTLPLSVLDGEKNGGLYNLIMGAVT
jgi:hypothetical protein